MVTHSAIARATHTRADMRVGAPISVRCRTYLTDMRNASRGQYSRHHCTKDMLRRQSRRRRRPRRRRRRWPTTLAVMKATIINNIMCGFGKNVEQIQAQQHREREERAQSVFGRSEPVSTHTPFIRNICWSTIDRGHTFFARFRSLVPLLILTHITVDGALLPV